jgi:hypothetical protein
MSETTAVQPGIFEDASKKYQYLLDKSSPHMLYRWIAFVVCLLLYFLRVYYKNGWFIVSYGLGIYLLNQFIGFLSPQVFFLDFQIPCFYSFSLYSLTQKRMILIQDYQQRILMSSGEIFWFHSSYSFFLTFFLCCPTCRLCRPFARRLPEFKFWHSSIRAIGMAFFMTFFDVFDVPVFWPILLLYFFVLFFITMKRQIKHMIKYRYIPFSWGKKKYEGKTASSSK